MLRNGSPLWSQDRNGVSGLILRWGGELVLSLEVQQGSQTSLSVGTGNSEFHSSHCDRISPYVELRGNTTYRRDLGVLLEFQQVRQGSASSVSGTSGFLSN